MSVRDRYPELYATLVTLVDMYALHDVKAALGEIEDEIQAQLDADEPREEPCG